MSQNLNLGNQPIDFLKSDSFGTLCILIRLSVIELLFL